MNLGLLYWIAGVCQGFGVLLTVCSVLGLFTCIAFTIWHMTEQKWNSFMRNSEEEWKALHTKVMRRVKIGFVLCSVGIVCAILIPNRQDVVAMYIIPRIENNQFVKDVSKKAFDRIMRILDDDLNGSSCSDGKCRIGE